MMKISLRLRFALLTATLLILCCICLVFIAGYSNNVMLSNIKNVTSSTSCTLPYAPLKVFDDQQTQNETRLFFGFLAIILLGTLTSYWVAGIALKPLRQLTHSIRHITEENLNTTLPSLSVSDEIQDLSTSFNEMLGRLEQAFQKEKRFSVNVAHELKTPLTILRTKYEVFEMSPHRTVADYKKVLSISKDNVERLTKVVECLLALQAPTLSLQLQQVDLSLLIQDIILLLTPLAEQSSITLASTLPPLTILAHRDLLYRALFNVIENAIKYNIPGGKVNIVCNSTPNTMTLSIYDTGIGIPDESIPLLCEAFYRVDPSRNRKIGGSGLGLTLASEIITLHKGTFHITSELGKGSCFSITLPFSSL